ncbi:MAG: hypothetical protein O9292_06055 [Rhodobacteraceae bacterium]|nr:hypothetical protein [Paracoccaceae bacterium]
MAHLWKRDKIWWFRMRCPRKYRSICDQEFLTQSLGTDSKTEAEELVPIIKKQFLAELDARLSGEAPEQTREAYHATLALAKTQNIKLKSMQDLVNGPVRDVVERIERLQQMKPTTASALFAVQLGNFPLPTTSITELARDMSNLRPDEVATKNERQVRVWKAKWLRAAEAFVAAVGKDKAISEIDQQDAFDTRRWWQNKLTGEERITSEYANKHLGYMRAMIDTYFADAQIDAYGNVFADVRIEQKPVHERKKKEARKPEFSPNWIADNILKPGALPKLNAEARDILIVCAETGCRESEVFDLPETSIVLDAPIPHISIRVEEGPVGQRRDIKTAASIRDVPLVGAALDAMKRNPKGFPRYRGNANYYNTAQKHFRDNFLLPSDDHTLGGLRHSYESRMRRAGIDNEERGFMMGHSLKKIRGREVYGDETSLRLRALFAEMVALPTETWKPRPHSELRAEIEKLLREEGFRVA